MSGSAARRGPSPREDPFLTRWKVWDDSRALASGTAFAQASNAKAEVERAVTDFVAAYGGGAAMLEKYFGYYADDMSVMQPAGRWSKQAYYTMWKDTTTKGNGTASASIKDLVVQISPGNDVGIATFQMPTVYNSPQGPRPPVTWNLSTTWFKQGGTWTIKSVTFYQNAAPPAAPPAR